MGLIDTLPPGPVGIDTAIFIYFVEENGEYLPIVSPLFEAAAAGRLDLVTSGITLLEVLVVPFRSGDAALASRYEALLTRSRGLELVEIDRRVLRLAAEIRGVHAVRTPDAIQMATALSRKCGCFLTNDGRIPVLPSLPVVQLSDHIGGGDG